MLARFEHRSFAPGARMWICAYSQLRNEVHWHLEPEIIALQEGSATVRFEDGCFELHPGEVFCVPPDSTHAIETRGDCRLLVLLFDREVFPLFRLRDPRFPDQYGVIGHLWQVYREFCSPNAFSAEKALCIVKCLLIDIIRHQERTPMESLRTRSVQRLDQLVLMMESDPDAAGFSAAAKFMNMSEAYFSRFFKRCMGVTFSHYVNVLRIEKALDVLAREPHVTMSEVMRRCGFFSLRSFNRVFKELTGYTPTQLPEGFRLVRRSLVKDRPRFDPTTEACILPPL